MEVQLHITVNVHCQCYRMPSPWDVSVASLFKSKYFSTPDQYNNHITFGAMQAFFPNAQVKIVCLFNKLV